MLKMEFKFEHARLKKKSNAFYPVYLSKSEEKVKKITGLISEKVKKIGGGAGKVTVVFKTNG